MSNIFSFVQSRTGNAATSETAMIPLSYAQQRLWFVDQLEPGNAAYHLPLALRVKGRLNPEVLERSLSEIVRRHEVLRTSFPMRHGQARQHIAAAEALPLPIIDLAGLPDSA